jgi:hypothetical protein
VALDAVLKKGEEARARAAQASATLRGVADDDYSSYIRIYIFPFVGFFLWHFWHDGGRSVYSRHSYLRGAYVFTEGTSLSSRIAYTSDW